MPSSCSRSAGRPARDMPAGVEGAAPDSRAERARTLPPSKAGKSAPLGGGRAGRHPARAPLGRTGSWGLEPLFEGSGKLVWNPNNPAIAKEGRTFPESALEIIDTLAEAGKDAWPDLFYPLSLMVLRMFLFRTRNQPRTAQRPSFQVLPNFPCHGAARCPS